MEQYYLRNWRTFPFKQKSFEGQLDRFAIACVTSIKAPNVVLDIVPIWGRSNESGMGKYIKLIYQKEQGYELDKESRDYLSYFSKPIDGEFVQVKSIHGPLFRIFTQFEAENGLCGVDQVNNIERDLGGQVIFYNSIKVFTWSRYDSDFGKYNYVRDWFPKDMYAKYVYYRYFPRHMLESLLV